MQRFSCRVNDGNVIILQLVRTRKHNFRFVNLTDSYLVPKKFPNPARALDWLDQHFGPTNWEDISETENKTEKTK